MKSAEGFGIALYMLCNKISSLNNSKIWSLMRSSKWERCYLTINDDKSSFLYTVLLTFNALVLISLYLAFNAIIGWYFFKTRDTVTLRILTEVPHGKNIFNRPCQHSCMLPPIFYTSVGKRLLSPKQDCPSFALTHCFSFSEAIHVKI